MISVRDNGIGIDPELLPHVFDLFTQADRSLDRSQGGLGIGLTLVRSLVEMHGGTVEAHSEGPGKGSEFIGPPAAIAPRPQTGARATAGKSVPRRARRILVVDDNVGAAKVLARLLGQDRATRGPDRPRRSGRLWRWPRHSGPRWSCWTSACRA